MSIPKTCKACGTAYQSYWGQSKRGVHCNACLALRSEMQRAAIGEVQKARREGLLAAADSQICVDCAAPAKHYDHRDYRKPLDVQPVCHGCNVRRGSALFYPPSPKSEPKPVVVHPLFAPLVAKLNETKLSPAEIAEGSGLSERWVRMFRKGEIPNPGVFTLGRLAKFLDRPIRGDSQVAA